jgi:hypothetical protein
MPCLDLYHVPSNHSWFASIPRVLYSVKPRLLLLRADSPVHILVSTVSLLSPLLRRILVSVLQRFGTTESACS